MKVNVPLDHGFLPDKYAKKAAPEFQLKDHPIVSFPIDIQMHLLALKPLH